MTNKVLLDSLDGSFNAGSIPPAGVVLENMRRRGFDFLRLWIYGRRHSRRSMAACYATATTAALAGWIIDGWITAAALFFVFLLISLKLDTAKKRMSSIVVILGDRLTIADAEKGRATGAERVIPFASIERIEVESRVGVRTRDRALRISSGHGTVHIGEGLSTDALKWLRSYLVMEVTGLTWKPIFTIGRKEIRDRDGADGEAPPIAPGITPKLARLYLQEARGHIEALVLAVHKGNSVGIKREAHWLKSSSANVGARKLSELAQLIEARALNNDLAEAQASRVEIETEFARVRSALELVAAEGDLALTLRPGSVPRFDLDDRPEKKAGRLRFEALVLVVEDSMVNQEVAAEYLRELGCAVEVAANGQEAIDICKAARFDLVLMDCQMPIVDGYQATRSIRQVESELASKPVPIVALTANTGNEDRVKCMAAGMTDFMAKPFDEQALGRMLATWIPHKQVRVVEPEDEFAA